MARQPAQGGFRRGQRPARPSEAFTREQEQAEDQFGSFHASLLYCPKCRQATPTRERLLLVLPTGNLYEYLCIQCGTSTGSKTDTYRSDVRLYLP
ncbi:cytoplasmic protein [Nitrospira sp. Kam-Ns4a]